MIFFIPKERIPEGRKPSYPRFVVDIQPQKEETHRTRLRVGGNLIEYPGSVTTKTAEVETAKILFNSILSTKDAKFATIDIKSFYLNTPMGRYEYMNIPYHLIPDKVKKEYNLNEIVKEGFVYMEIHKGIYGLPQAGKIANDQLIKHL
eukprot:13132723-Ditylum_brightwellii.AAC.1